MNKRIFSLLMVLAMVLTFAPIAPIAADAAAATTCPHCGVALSEIEWKELPSIASSATAEQRWLSGGHYKVPAAGVTAATYFQTSNDAGTTTEDIIIDLNGAKITRGNGLLWSIYVPINVHIFDSSEAQTGEIKGRTMYGSGCQVTMHSGKHTGGTFTGTETGGAVSLAGSATAKTSFNMKGGLITGGVTKAQNGGNVNVGSNCIFTVGADATISDGYAGTLADEANGVTATKNNGGNINSSGTLHVYGTVTGGKATCYGGNIMVIGGTATLYEGCKVTNGEYVGAGTGTTNGGGNIFVYKNNTLTIKGGEVSGGKATYGGNIHTQTGVTINVEGGTIKDGTATKSATNMYIEDGGKLNLTGGSIPSPASGINCYFAGSSSSSITLDGNAVCGQLYLAGTEATAPVSVKKGFTGNVTIRYVDAHTVHTEKVTEGTAISSGLTAEAGYDNAGKIVLGGNASTNGNKEVVAYNGAFYAPAKLSFGVNHYDPQLKLPQTNTSSKYYLKTAFASEAALWDYYANFDVEGVEIFIRVDPAATELTDITVPENGLRDGGVCINMSGIDAGITAPDTAVVEAWDSTRDVFTPYIYGGTVPAVSSTGTGVHFINLADEWGSVTSYRVYLNVKAYLRAASETIALQGSYEVDTAGAVEIDEIGMNLYDTNGTLVGSVKYTAEIDPFVAEALDDLKNGGLYDAAYVALQSTGDKTTWWDDDVVAKAHMIVDGEVYEGGARTVNYKASVEKLYGNAEYHEVIADMIANTTHAGAYEGWDLVAPEAAA